MDKVANTALLPGLMKHDSSKKYVMSMYTYIAATLKECVILQIVFGIATSNFTERYPFGEGGLANF